MAADRREYYLANRERLLAAAKARYEAQKLDPEWRAKINARNRERDRENPDAKRAYGKTYREKLKTDPVRKERVREKDRAHQRRKFRLKAGIVGATSETRTGKCPICPRDSVKLVPDHEHGPDGVGPIRGWICERCNLGLGNLGDTYASLGRALAYLKAFEESRLTTQPDRVTLIE
jgi:hypothetical protein